MKRLVLSLLAIIALAAFPLTAASASVAKPSGSLFTCPSATVCIFQNSNYTGIEESYSPASSHGFWIHITGIFPPSGTGVPESVNDNSNSAVEFYSTSANAYRCVAPGGREAIANHPYDYLYIAYNVANCDSIPPF